jgi:hypothetical protein
VMHVGGSFETAFVPGLVVILGHGGWRAKVGRPSAGLAPVFRPLRYCGWHMVLTGYWMVPGTSHLAQVALHGPQVSTLPVLPTVQVLPVAVLSPARSALWAFLWAFFFIMEI